MTRRVIVTVTFLFAAFLGFRVVQFAFHLKNHPLPRDPGAEAVSAAARLIMSAREGVAHGNTPAAHALAEKLSKELKTIRETLFEGGNPDSIDMKLLTQGEFVVFCQLNQDSCVFLIHVPEMVRYTTTAKDSLIELAHLSAAQTLDTAPQNEVQKLAVATRGNILFDRVLIGDYQPQSKEPLSHTKKPDEVGVLVPSLNPFFTPPKDQPANTQPE